MRRVLSRVIIGASVVALVAFNLIGCGGGTSNNQGTSFTFLGWFDPTDTDQNLLGLSTTLSGSPGIAVGAVGLQNNLVGQIIRVQRLEHEFYIPGATEQPPSTAFPLGVVLLSPVGEEGEPGTNSSLPGTLTGDGNVVYAESYVVPPEIMEWINLNRNSLPEPPFTMNVISRAYGVTSAGDVMYSNDMAFSVTFLPDTNIGEELGDGGSTSSSDSSSS